MATLKLIIAASLTRTNLFWGWYSPLTNAFGREQGCKIYCRFDITASSERDPNKGLHCMSINNKKKKR